MCHSRCMMEFACAKAESVLQLREYKTAWSPLRPRCPVDHDMCQVDCERDMGLCVPPMLCQGSTCAMVDSILRCCGYKTGLFTSPHLWDVRERIQLDGCAQQGHHLTCMHILSLTAVRCQTPQGEDCLMRHRTICTPAGIL